MSGLYYSDEYVEIWHGDCREISLPKVDLILSDPPYGINYKPQSGKVKGKLPEYSNRFTGELIIGDDKLFDPSYLLSLNTKMILWGGNHFAGSLPSYSKWLVCELAWTNLEGQGTRVFRHFWDGFNKASERGESRVHPTQKPVALMKWCLGFCIDAECVLDPFLGSGSVLRAAKDLGRKAIGIEIEERYCEIAAKRCNEAQPSMYRLLEAKEKQGCLIE